MKINLKQVLVNLEGKELKNHDGKPFTVGEGISSVLISAEIGGKMKMFVLAQNCYKDETIDVDKADLELIKKAIEATKIYTVLISGQLLSILSEIKE